MNKSQLAQLIHRYKQGLATEQEKVWLQKYWEEALHDSSYIDSLTREEKEILRAEIFLSISKSLTQKRTHRTVELFRAHPWMYRVAAALLILFAVTAVWFINYHGYTEIQTAYGERVAVILPDQSSVVLNGNSKMRYAKSWSSDEIREVWIEGEGFFEVQHTRNHQQFIVHTSEGLQVEVLGTKFNVKSREQKTEVLLTEGKVKLDQASMDQAVYLKPGELATVQKNQFSKRTVKDRQYTSWVESKLFFDKTPLEELAQTLKETYGLQVVFQTEELKSRQLSGEISSASAEDILFAVAETFDIEVSRKGNTIIFSTKH